MTDVRDDVLPELMAGLFGRIRAELSDGTLGDLRMSHVRVLAAIPPEGINVTELARRAKGNVSEMARRSGMERHHVRAYLRKYRLDKTS